MSVRAVRSVQGYNTHMAFNEHFMGEPGLAGAH